MGDRARLTVTDVLVLLLALAAIAAIYPAYVEVLDTHASVMSTEVELVFRAVLPVMLIIILSVIYLESVSGAAR